MMPGQDGFELCRTIRSEAADTMVIFLSALGETSDKVLGLTLGAVDYITKPIQTEEVLARVSNHLARQHLEREVRRHRDRLNKELDSAARMQRLLLPTTLPHRSGCSSRRITRPAGTRAGTITTCWTSATTAWASSSPMCRGTALPPRS